MFCFVFVYIYFFFVVERKYIKTASNALIWCEPGCFLFFISVFKFGIVMVTFIMKTDLFSSTPKPTLTAFRRKQIRGLNQQIIPRLHSCFNVGFKHSLMSVDSIAYKTNSILKKDSQTTALKHTEINQQPDH